MAAKGYDGIRPFEILTDDHTILDADSDKVFLIATDAKTITLPLVADLVAGFMVTIINSGAAGNNIVTISPNAADGIKGNLSSSVGANADATTADGLVAQASGANDKDWINTKATANQGDRVTLIADGIADWFIMDGVGIWVSES